MKINKNIVKGSIIEVSIVMISFMLYVCVYFLLMGIIVLLLGPNNIMEQARNCDSYKEILVLMLFAGGLWGLSSEFYNLIKNSITIIMKKITEIHNKKNIKNL